MVTRQDVFTMLKSFGISPCDKVTMHTSLKAIGQIEHGAEGLLDALREYLSEGLLIIPTHTWAGIADRLYYDPLETKPCIGVLPTIAAFHPEAIRSSHPTHSVAVFGKEAAEYVKQEKNYSTPTPADNCLSRLYEERGKVLLVGVGFESNTYLHAVEERLEIPNRIDTEVLPITGRTSDGSSYSVLFRGHKAEGAEFGISEHYPILEKPFLHMGAVSCGRLGNAKVLCCDAYKMTEAYKVLHTRIGRDFLIDNKEISSEFYLCQE